MTTPKVTETAITAEGCRTIPAKDEPRRFYCPRGHGAQATITCAACDGLLNTRGPGGVYAG